MLASTYPNETRRAVAAVSLFGSYLSAYTHQGAIAVAPASLYELDHQGAVSYVLPRTITPDRTPATPPAFGPVWHGFPTRSFTEATVPAGPVAPGLPCGPAGPVLPFKPCAPRAPGRPRGPLGPRGPRVACF